MSLHTCLYSVSASVGRDDNNITADYERYSFTWKIQAELRRFERRLLTSQRRAFARNVDVLLVFFQVVVSLAIRSYILYAIYLLCIQELMSKIEMLEEDRTEISKEFENLGEIMTRLEQENKVSDFCFSRIDMFTCCNFCQNTVGCLWY